jgi:hypothetical protein
MATPMESFYQSCEEFANYPKNLTTHDILHHTSQAYHERLEKRLNNRLYPLCDEQKAAIVFWDLTNGETGISLLSARTSNMTNLSLQIQNIVGAA